MNQSRNIYIHPEATAPPQPLFGKDIDKSINSNFDKIKLIYSKEPKSYAEVIQANKDINVYKQNINRIKKGMENQFYQQIKYN